MTKEDQDEKLSRIIKKACVDEQFRQRLLADATAVLKDEGVSVPDGLAFKAVEDTDTVSHVVLPAAPKEWALSMAQLDGISGGFIFKGSR